MKKLGLLLTIASFNLLIGCGPSKEQQEQWAIESCLEGNAKVNGIPQTVKESEAARKYCLEVYRGKY